MQKDVEVSSIMFPEKESLKPISIMNNPSIPAKLIFQTETMFEGSFNIDLNTIDSFEGLKYLVLKQLSLLGIDKLASLVSDISFTIENDSNETNQYPQEKLLITEKLTTDNFEKMINIAFDENNNKKSALSLFVKTNNRYFVNQEIERLADRFISLFVRVNDIINEIERTFDEQSIFNHFAKWIQSINAIKILENEIKKEKIELMSFDKKINDADLEISKLHEIFDLLINSFIIFQNKTNNLEKLLNTTPFTEYFMENMKTVSEENTNSSFMEKLRIINKEGINKK